MSPLPRDRAPSPAGQTTDDEPRLAVALRQPAGEARARLTAKGRGALAEQILEVAFARGVKVRSDADLAQILDTVDVDSEIPLPALAAVAEIMSYLYRANRQSEETR